MYDGEWQYGRRHGKGSLRWNQKDTESMHANTGVRGTTGHLVRKVYDGEFQDDLFHGKGALYMNGVKRQKRPPQYKPDEYHLKYFIPRAILHPEELIEVHG